MPESPNPKLHTAPDPPAEVFAPDGEGYAELEVTTNFSFLRGASHADELVLQAARLGYRAIAVTDVNTLAGVVRMHDAVKQVAATGWAPKLIIGARLAFVDAPNLLVWMPDRAAYGRLCRLLTLGRRRAEKGACELYLADFLEHQEGMLAALCGGEAGREDAAREGGRREVMRKDPFSCLRELKGTMGDRLSLAVSFGYGQDDATRVRRVAELGRRAGVPLLTTNHVHYHVPQRRPLQDVLTCIRHGCTIHEAGFRLFPNAERYLKSPGRMRRLFADYPQAIERGLEIAGRCAFSLDELRYEYPDEVAPAGMTAIEYLSSLAWNGAKERYPGGVPEKVQRLIEHELRLIGQLKIEAYFLTVYDLVSYARSRGILCQGRGSAANSAVCYCIGVTSVDPARIDVLFERFVSAARNEPPDIDIDFEHERREEVIQYIYEKYGRERAGMTATVITYRGRSAVRDVGKALGLGLDMVDQLAGKLDWWHRGTLSDAQLAESGVDPRDLAVRQVVALTAQLLGFPRHLSQHTGGMVITRGPLCEMVPIENASMENRTVIEWDKDDIDALGILKIDVLALGMLTCISKAFGYISASDEATKRRSDEARQEGGADGNSENISGSDRVAEGEGAGEAGLHSHSPDAGGRAFRPDEPDVACSRVDSFEHRRGTCTAESGGVSQVSAHCAGFPGGTDDPGGDSLGIEANAHPRGNEDAVGGSRPCSAGPDSRAGTEKVDACSLRRFVAPSLRRYELHTIPPEDPGVYDMICDADTIGVFQIESRAQMSMLPRLRPRCFYDLVIEVAIVRPGPIQGNMVHPYLRRRDGIEPVTYPSKELEAVLGKTLGVPLFQEQAMRVAMVGAGFSGEDADRLRRAMAAWRKSGEIERFHVKIVEGMVGNGYTAAFAEQCFAQIRGFAEYGFPESHAASFALLVYVSAWIKRYHPAAFACALLNCQPMGFYAPAQIVRDAREHGVEVREVDVNFSGWDCSLESDKATKRRSDEGGGKETWGRGGPALRLGFRQIKGMRKEDAERIVAARQRQGRFVSVEQLQRATGLTVHAIRRLAEADAFGSMGLARRHGVWEALGVKEEEMPLFASDEATERRSDEGHADNVSLPTPSSLPFLPPIPIGQEVMTDYAMQGLSLKRHPVSLVREKLDAMRIRPAATIGSLPNGARVKVAGLVLIRQRPGTASGIVFETLEDETGIVNLIIRPNVYERYRPAARHGKFVQAEGYVEKQDKVVHVMVQRIFDLSHMLAGFSMQSRDFH